MGNKLKYYIKTFISLLFSRVKNWNQEIELETLKKRFAKCGADFYAHHPYVISGADKMQIGNHVRLGSFLQIWAEGGISIGDDCLIASHVSINSLTHSVSTKKFKDKNIASPVIIGNNVWVGSHVIILPGVTIGDNSVIGAGTVVTKDIPQNSIVVGVPGRIINTLNK